jgi:hypothetical protein
MMIYELERIYKVAFMAQSPYPRILHGGSEENHGKTSE